MIKKVALLAATLGALLAIIPAGSTGVNCDEALMEVANAVQDTTSANVAAWSSGWVTVNRGSFHVLTHGVGGEMSNYAVDLWFWDTDEGGLGIHNFAYGGLEQGGNWQGGYWSNLTTSTVVLQRELNDQTSDLMMVRLRVVGPPDYDSNWQEIAEGEGLTLTHDLGGDPADYAVSMWFDDQETLLGVHNYRFGGAEEAGSFYGVHWQNLTDSTIRVIRAPDELYADRVRVRIVKTPPTPDFDSGWQAIEAGETLTLTHNLGGPLALYRGLLQYRDTSGLSDTLGLHARFLGGMAVGDNLYGGHWQRLTSLTVEIYRQPAGERSTDVRVRLWGPQAAVCLPLVLRNTTGQVNW